MYAHPRKHVYMSKSACTIMGPPAFSSSVAGLFFERTDNSPSYPQTIQCRAHCVHTRNPLAQIHTRPFPWSERPLRLDKDFVPPPLGEEAIKKMGTQKKRDTFVDVYSGLSSCVLLNPELLLLSVSNPAGVILKQ